ncbi:MAG: type II secretion system protein F [Gammaproteobacteria bacterium]|nr:MAG: type II secretion system protein F [Gammaproteobacteria bacterium]
MAKVSSQTYQWQGLDRKGNKAKGEIVGTSIALIKAELRKQGVSKPKVKKKATPMFGLGGAKRSKITPGDIAVFSRQLATMMKAGVPLVSAFEIVADGLDNANLRDLVMDIKAEVEGGNSLANSIRKKPEYFDELFCNLVDAGEQSGALETMLDRIATYKEKTEALKSKIKKALNYPIAVVVIAIVVTMILLIKVVPTFQDLFAGFGAELPAFTQFVIGISETVQEWWFVWLICIFIFGFAFKKAKAKSLAFNHFLDRVILKLPIIAPIMHKAVVARFARTLATTFSAGVPLVEALESVAGATGNYVYQTAVLKVQEDVSTGTQLQTSMRAVNIFPSMAVQMVAIGEESGALDTMLDKVASYYEAEVDNAVDGLTSLMEPLIMSVLGVLVGGLIIAMYLPIFQMGNAI